MSIFYFFVLLLSLFLIHFKVSKSSFLFSTPFFIGPYSFLSYRGYISSLIWVFFQIFFCSLHCLSYAIHSYTLLGLWSSFYLFVFLFVFLRHQAIVASFIFKSKTHTDTLCKQQGLLTSRLCGNKRKCQANFLLGRPSNVCESVSQR